ncbi:MAG: DNA mismatch repair endonuclease MutL [Balneolaceae bacterium]
MSEHIEPGASVIFPMPPDLVNKIAAGEVIQRPGSVVKELLDNSLDSGADEITIVIQNAGRSLIQVIDNGCGMNDADAKLCFSQHATSKIRSVDDLFKIRTLGFRGEAMASIASVSQAELKTRRHGDDAGILYEVHGGEEVRFEPAAAEEGTSVAVRNLFYNVPARRQFLRTDATELRHILRTVHNAALAHTNISFELIADTDTIYKLPAQPLEQRVAEIFGRQYRASLIPFHEETSYVRIHGLLGDPKISKKSRGEQFLYVNNRPVQHRYLTHLLLSLYDAWQGEREYPFFAVFLELDPGQVDVNVHPAKLEVKFEDEKSIIQLTRSVVKKALNEYLLVPDIEKRESGEKQSFDTSFREFQSIMERPDKGGEVHIPSRINESGSGLDGTELGRALYESGKAENRERVSQGQKSVESGSEERGFWQLHNSYILTQTRTGLCMIDQHAAHVRIIYEKTLSATEESLPGTQQLLFAQTMELSATDFSQLRELLPIIQRMGFSIQLLSGNTAIINGVPADIDIGDERKVLREMLQQYRDLDRTVQMDARHKVAISFASRTAIPAGRRLSATEMEMIIDQLFSCNEPYMDPLKKPILIYLSMEEIRNKFR